MTNSHRSIGRTVLGAALASTLAVGAFAGAAAADTGTAPGQEPYRPQLHFSPDQNWMNDPNGLIYNKGVYNLYFQYNPSGNEWGNISWGHATSTDLMNWTMQPVAIPQGPTEYIYSGSAVLDSQNTSGFGTAANPPMVAVYTSQYHDDPVHGNVEAQSLAYSTDDGMTWTKYAGNPVLDLGLGDFRDPKVFWYGSKTDGHWVMVAVKANESQIVVSTSPDLKSWTQQSTFSSTSVPGFWECPDLYPMPLDGDSKDVKWVMAMSAGGSKQSYVVGDFDGKKFTEDDSVDYDAVATASVPAGTDLGSFDDGSYDGWTVQNDPTVAGSGPFGSSPATGAVSGQQTVTGFAGKGLANSFLGQDAAIGSMTSPEFTVDSKYIDFLVGGGNHPRTAGTGSGEAPPGDTLFDFETNGKTLADEGWTGTGDLSAADQPAGPHQQPNVAQGFQGTGYLSTFYTPNGNDNATGTLTSPTFTVSKKYLDLLVGGGERDPGSDQTLAVQLVVDGQVVESETGTNEHLMNWRSWDLSAYQGKQAQLRVVDTATGSWAGLWVDDVVQSDQAAVPRSTETTVDLVVDGKTVESTTGPSTDGTVGPQAEFLNWKSWDVSAYQGKKATIQVIDNNTGGFGHIMADQFTASDVAATPNPAPEANQLDWGHDNYASNTYNDAPDGKRISVGWMGQAFTSPTSPWRGNATLPRELSLQTIDGRPQIVTQFASQLASYQDDDATYQVPAGDITEGVQQLPAAADGSVQRVQATLTPGDASDFGIMVRGGAAGTGTKIGYDVATQSVYVDRSASGAIPSDQLKTPDSAPAPLVDGKLKLDVVVDHGSVEVVANGGRRILSEMIYPSDTDTHVSLYSNGGTAHVDAMKVIPMYSSMRGANPPPLPPTISSVSVGNGDTVSGKATFKVKLADDASDLSYTYIELNKGAGKTWVTDNTKAPGSTNSGKNPKLVVDTATLADGTYGLKIDAVGTNGKTAEQNISFTIKNAPVLTFKTPASGATASGKTVVRVKLASLNPQAYNLRIDSAGLQYVYQPSAGVQTYTLDTTTLSDGVHTLLATATDKDGDKTTITEKITVTNGAAS